MVGEDSLERFSTDGVWVDEGGQTTINGNVFNGCVFLNKHVLEA